jgi:hypothetical protein
VLSDISIEDKVIQIDYITSELNGYKTSNEEFISKTHHIHFAVLRKMQMKVGIVKEMH